MRKKYLKPSFTTSEILDIREKGEVSRSFRTSVLVKKVDFTPTLLEELDGILNGPIPRNFVLNIKGGMGRQTGIFKTCLGIQKAIRLDPSFDVHERMAFTPRQMIENVKSYARRKQVFILDEQVHDLKQSSETMMANIIESCRERQLCFILIGVPERYYTFSDYTLERLGESNDRHLPRKTVYYSVSKLLDGKKTYRGIFKWNVTPLTDEEWKSKWGEYMKMKDKHQQLAIEQKVTGFNIEKYAKTIISFDSFEECLNDEGKIPRDNRGYLKTIIFKEFPDMTNDERGMIYFEILSEYAAKKKK